MRHPSFPEGVLVALAAGLGGSMAFTVLAGPFGVPWTARALITGLGLGYVFYLLYRSREPSGRIVGLGLCLSLSGLSALLIDDALPYLAVHLAMVWLVRAFYHQPGPLAAVFDLALNLLALMAGIWAFRHADSVFLGTWAFFLVQALFTGIPALTGQGSRADSVRPEPIDRFQLAYRSAEAALRKLSAHP